MRCTFSWCKFGSRVQKPTDLWVHNLPMLGAFLGTEEEPKFICTEAEPCWLNRCHDTVRGNAKKYTAFPHKLCCPWQTMVDTSLASQRLTPARAFADDDDVDDDDYE